jgi:hypothetical protein
LSYPGRSDDQVQRMNSLLTDGSRVQTICIYSFKHGQELKLPNFRNSHP